jgi:adenine-specific DNA methylase
MAVAVLTSLAEPLSVVEDDNRHARGAFFTPQAIADFLASWAIRTPDATVLDPTCGESVFLIAAGRHLRTLGADLSHLDSQVYGIDLHAPSLDASVALLTEMGLDAHLTAEDVFDVPTPDQLGCPLPLMDAVVGNPPFVRYQEHRGEARRRSVQAALRQGVRLSGLASSWASVVIHASGFLKPDGRLAMVLPAELLTVHYAEPVRQWLRNRFSGVTLVMFERLQFEDALENVVLLLAHGSGGCDSFQLKYVSDASDLAQLQFGDAISVLPASQGKWTDLLLPISQRRLYRQAVEKSFVPLDTYGSPTLGTVTGGNDFFTLSDATKEEFGLREEHLKKICPPGTRHLRSLSFGMGDWNQLREAGERVWLLHPEPTHRSAGLQRYIAFGKSQGIDSAYKCQIRSPWWRPPAVAVPDLFFTYMSHRYPRLIANTARVSFVNSMHGLRLKKEAPAQAKAALPLLMLNSVTMLGAEVVGRSYGGGILKMEPREAAALPLPKPNCLAAAWEILRPERDALNRQLQNGLWTNVVARVDEVLLRQVLGLSTDDGCTLHGAARDLRARRLTRGTPADGDA